MRNPFILLESRQRRRIAARDPEHPIAEDPLGIGHVQQRFLERPLPRPVRLFRGGVGHRLEQRDGLEQLGAQMVANVAVRDQRDVLAVVLEIFVGRRTAEHCMSSTSGV